MSYSTRWRNYGLGFAYIVFNICAAVLLYYLLRVRKWGGVRERLAPVLGLFKRKKEDKRKESKGEEKEKEKTSQDPDEPILPQ